ncbi:hypothetical protein DFA_01574 [Cavenderia fasciculata]|uniref:THH1/TOM1/TOM3 domain-containing protein n=1 Tax=Cavenderia fasciculata TaxID=261658 RepID=F4PTL8_CACFS|nr:uncharacterized protein DFA_01574 [Cavenderia fasciculata]EGG21688.1 hypothetical protein DFA_01574 [Cavenderia fasciculata]|eukprot:XP_004359538.1 hypothetical protein DFA_01574 [Cavenderia fasciculata]
MDNGQYLVGAAAQCATAGTCSSVCGYQCQTNGVTGCIYTPAVDSGNCQAVQNSTWNAARGICQVTVPQTTCTSRPNHIWLNCAAKSVSECYSPLGSDPLEDNLCVLVSTKCNTKEECEASGGCSDAYFFQSKQTVNYTNGLGKCVHGHYAYKSNWPVPTCLDDSENDSPKGCFSSTPLVFTEAECLELGPDYSWWAPAITQAQCTSQMGCKTIDTAQQNLPNNYRFNQMDQDLCETCSDISHEWTNMFEWIPGVWTPSIPVKPQWIKPDFRHSSSIQKVLDFGAIATELNYGYYTHVSDLLRSASLCRMERVEENLNSISCSCSGPGGSECFTTSALMLGETKPCANEQSSFSFSYGMLQFKESSVPFACTSVLVSQVSRQLFKATELQTLSSNFVSYRKPDDFALLNSRGAIIGTILSDGVKIQAQGVNSYTLCFSSSATPESYKLSVLDFVIEEDILVPMEVNITSIIDSTDNITYKCAFLPNVNPTATYLLVARIDDYQNKQKEVFDKGATGLIYTLAVIFLLASIWGLVQLAITGYKCYQGLEKPKLVHSLIVTVTVFMLIRSIYFFILPSGKLSTSAVADYILVVLPTFIYFTAFTIIIVLWYIIVKSRTQRNILRRIGLMIGTINAILYILFIIIILVFHLTESNPTNDCIGRMVVEANTTTPQRIVSIVYAVVQAVISLVIGAAFVYLGGTLYFMMRFKKVDVDNDHRDQQQKRISVVTLACSVGFILHCVFVLILVGAEPSNIIFSFIGLLITEVIPVISILYSYNQGSLSGVKQTTNTSKLSYVTDSRENFNSSANSSSVNRTTYDSSFTSSSRG